MISSNTQVSSGVVWNPSNFKMTRGPSLGPGRSRSALRGPGGSGTDVSMTRIIPLEFIRESMNMMFRAEFFSLLNHPQMGAPEVRLGRATTGTIQTVTGQRVLQFGLKIAYRAPRR